ncbi:hypothetical protein LNKW23_38630 [Paralimibaculum aggregatum]|uniref:Bile acid:sodium symporter n=1 Tax=Paralimibaculum aggregatum TaxID=3036245 RepID=A0ABQ6LN66_9RHOB|nr:hypothetical protein [Limibaculum sp. NKW23]GMG84647.1 hypothetical protein LNKW23_38630 [Limibaculum sp. NKW23]
MARLLLAGLGAIGGRARWVLAVGVMLALLLPGLSAGLRPFLPGLVVLVFAVAVARLDMRDAARAALRPRRMLRLAALVLALLVVTPAVLWGLGRLAGLGPEGLEALVYTGAAPPITSAAGLCLLMGLDAALALELTVVASVAAPFLGPAVVAALLGDAVPIDAWALALRMGAMILAGGTLGLLIRHLAGPARIAREARAFDGIGALAMLFFVVPLFDGVWEIILREPERALAMFALAVAVNFGMQAVVARGARGAAGPGRAGATGLAWGNRTVALYVAALPPDAAFGLYVALYQIPMLFTPLLMGRVLGARRNA